ncbi:PTS mannitol transporter subunit IIA, partial [Vibrio parahaemolyticus]
MKSKKLIEGDMMKGLDVKTIKLGQEAKTKEEAIRQAG